MIQNLVIPSWRLFDRLGTVPKLYVRVSDRSDVLDEKWESLSLSSKVSWWSLFFNPSGNLNHAICNVLERMLQDPTDDKNFETILNYLKYRLAEQPAKVQKFQFKLSAVCLEPDGLTEHDVLVSEELFL